MAESEAMESSRCRVVVETRTSLARHVSDVHRHTDWTAGEPQLAAPTAPDSATDTQTHRHRHIHDRRQLAD